MSGHAAVEAPEGQQTSRRMIEDFEAAIKKLKEITNMDLLRTKNGEECLSHLNAAAKSLEKLRSTLISSPTTSQVSFHGEDYILPYPDQQNQPLIGQKIVSTDKIIAIGSNTTVYEGSFGGRPVAVKRILRTHYEVAVKEIENLLKSDNHPNIVRYFGVQQNQDFIYLALERCICNLDDFIQMADSSQYALIDDDFSTRDVTVYKDDGLESLKKVVGDVDEFRNKANGYPSSALLELMRDIVSGLVHLHKLRIIHQDLKPQNILISKNQGCFCAKLSDMGISKVLRENKSSLSKRTGSGTSGWKAPELLHKERQTRQTRAIDMFGLGCLLFFCITRGRHPFGGPFERDNNIVQNNMDLFLVKDIPEAYHLISQLLNADPDLRPTAIQVSNHPLFWDSEKRLSFLRITSDRVGENPNLLKALDGLKKFKNWKHRVDKNIITHSEGKRKKPYRSGKVEDLLRLIRNKINHPEDTNDIKDLVGLIDEGLDEYFTCRFPSLLIEIYKLVRRHCADEGYFRKFL